MCEKPSLGDVRESTWKKAAEVYIKAAVLLNGFFSTHLAESCVRCLELHREWDPECDVARHEFVSGIFPGCCQTGVADDFRIPDGDRRMLPRGLCDYIGKMRAELVPAGVREYVALDLRTGRKASGRGCAWLADGGCLLGGLKSPICLSYLCPPLRLGLTAPPGMPDPVEVEDFLGFFTVLNALGDVSAGDSASLLRAEAEVKLFETRIQAYHAAGAGRIAASSPAEP